MNRHIIYCLLPELIRRFTLDCLDMEVGEALGGMAPTADARVSMDPAAYEFWGNICDDWEDGEFIKLTPYASANEAIEASSRFTFDIDRRSAYCLIYVFLDRYFEPKYKKTIGDLYSSILLNADGNSKDPAAYQSWNALCDDYESGVYIEIRSGFVPNS